MIPVLWVSRNPEILHRGYADQGLLEGVLSRDVWRPPGAFTFEHHEVRGDFLDVDGAVVVIPFRHHIDHVGWLARQLDRLAWAVVILTSDEEWLGNWRKLEGDNRRLWVMQPRPEHADVSWRLPCGPYAGTHEALAERTHPDDPRPLDWFFGGQVTHVRRTAALAALQPLERGELIATEGYFQGIPLADYLEREARAKVIACPSGPVSLCTARVEEALEAGCVPVLDMLKPEDPQFDYWHLVFGPDYPMPTITDWSTFPTVLQREVAAWPANANRCSAFWQQWKRKTAHQLHDDVRAVMSSGVDGQGQVRTAQGEYGTLPSPSTPDDLITVIVTTSPVTLHPSTEHIETTIDSIRAHLPDAEIIVACDGVRPEQERLRARYEEYLHRLFWLTNFHWRNVVPLRLEEWAHQAGTVRAALELVTTPLVMLVEHDTPLKETTIDWPGICRVLGSGQANLVRFHHESEILDGHGHLFPSHEHHLGAVPEITHGFSAYRTTAWWQRPHVASARFYRERVMPFFTPESRTMIEDPLYGHILDEIATHGPAAWWDWRLYVYDPNGNGTDMQRSYHLDSRGDEPKYPMRFPGQ